MRPRIIFITGTDTGVGKTVLTGLLISHLRRTGGYAIAIKPFCSGGRADAELLYSLQDGDFELDDINPFFFPEPVAPLVAARLHRRPCKLSDALRCLQKMQRKVTTLSEMASVSEMLHRADRGLNPSIADREPILLVEGAGGLVAPLGESFNLLDLIQKLMRAEGSRSRPNHPTVSVIVVAANRLGTINHTLLTVGKLQDAGVKSLTVVLMDLLSPRHSTPDTRHNESILTELMSPVSVAHLPYLGKSAAGCAVLKKSGRALAKTLRQILS